MTEAAARELRALLYLYSCAVVKPNRNGDVRRIWEEIEAAVERHAGARL